MELTTTILILTLAAGFITLLVGLFISIYPRRGLFLNIRDNLSLKTLVDSERVQKFMVMLSPPKKSKLYKLSESVIKDSETAVSVETLYLFKILSLFLLAAVVMLVRYTNIEIIRTSIISKPAQTVDLFQERGKDTYSYNFTLYTAVLKRIGENNLKKLDEKGKVEAVKKVLPDFIHTRNGDVVDEKAKSIVNTFNAVESVKLVDLSVILIVFAAFWLPELLLILKRVLLSSSYKKEVIKLENVFELLGSVEGFRTIDIIGEMERSSTSYRKHLKNFMEIFKRDKTLALETLKASVKNKRFSRLVDVIRIYSLTDKRLAVEILQRNRLEKEEQVFITAAEDIDTADIVAFASIAPILWELANLLLKPMLDMIFEAFKYV